MFYTTLSVGFSENRFFMIPTQLSRFNIHDIVGPRGSVLELRPPWFKSLISGGQCHLIPQQPR